MALSQTIPTSSGLSDLSLCFLTCYNVFGIVVFSELLFCFLDSHLCLLFCFQNRDLFCTSQPPYNCNFLSRNSDFFSSANVAGKKKVRIARFFFFYAIMYILIQTYTSHNSSRKKMKKGIERKKEKNKNK